MSQTDEGLIPVLEQGVNFDTVVTLEPPVNRENEEDSLSSISDAPFVDHFNISVSIITLFLSYLHTLISEGEKLNMYSLPIIIETITV